MKTKFALVIAIILSFIGCNKQENIKETHNDIKERNNPSPIPGRFYTYVSKKDNGSVYLTEAYGQTNSDQSPINAVCLLLQTPTPTPTPKNLYIK